MIDTNPLILELEDGKTGYFYSLHQLEEIRNRRILTMSVEQVASNYGRAKGSALSECV